jgi:hypothetical protein
VEITVRRGVTAPFTVQPLKVSEPLTAEDQVYIAEVKAEIAVATPEALKAIGFILSKKPQAVGDAVRADYKAKVAELKAAKEVT